MFGLGNPGRRYAGTRHNLGFMVLDVLVRSCRAHWRNRDDFLQADVPLGAVPCTLVKPLCYMNNSGLVVRTYLDNRYEDFAVVCDDLTLPFGRIRVRRRGSAGGHQGLASIIYQLERCDFPRVRLGIGPNPSGQDAADYVLECFSPEERLKLPAFLAAASEALKTMVEQGIMAAMNQFNAWQLPTTLENEPPGTAG